METEKDEKPSCEPCQNGWHILCRRKDCGCYCKGKLA